MGRASNLKKIRKYSTNEIDESLKRLDNSNLTDEEIFKICEDSLKLVEIHFKIGRKDNKMYNKYRKQIHEDLYKKIFTPDLVKEKDRKLTLKTLIKKENKFLYVLLMTEFQLLGQLYEVIRKNIPSNWLKFEDGKVMPELNLQSNTVKNNKEKINKHLEELYKAISVDEIMNSIRSEERYLEYSKIIKDKLEDMKRIKNETFEQSFYRYAFEELEYLYSDIKVMIEYVNSYINALSKMYKKEESSSAL